MTNKLFKGRVVHQDFLRLTDGTMVETEEMVLKMDTAGYYYFKPINDWREWRRSFQEIDIKKVENDLYHISFHTVSSPRFEIRSDAFLILEMTKEQICHWHKNDVWFSEEIGYIVRRAGKKIYGSKDSRRCIKCQYLQRNDAVVCDRGCE